MSGKRSRYRWVVCLHRHATSCTKNGLPSTNHYSCTIDRKTISTRSAGRPAGRKPTTRSGDARSSLGSRRGGSYKSALDGLIIRNMHIHNAGGECVRLRGESVFCAPCRPDERRLRRKYLHFLVAFANVNISLCVSSSRDPPRRLLDTKYSFGRHPIMACVASL